LRFGKTQLLWPVTETLSIKVPKELKVRLRAVAKSRKTKPSVLLRQALEIVISGVPKEGKPSLYELSKDLFDDLAKSGPRDLSTNPRHLDDLGK
jgi:hypothetical protein